MFLAQGNQDAAYVARYDECPSPRGGFPSRLKTPSTYGHRSDGGIAAYARRQRPWPRKRADDLWIRRPQFNAPRQCEFSIKHTGSCAFALNVLGRWECGGTPSFGGIRETLKRRRLPLIRNREKEDIITDLKSTRCRSNLQVPFGSSACHQVFIYRCALPKVQILSLPAHHSITQLFPPLPVDMHFPAVGNSLCSGDNETALDVTILQLQGEIRHGLPGRVRVLFHQESNTNLQS